MTSAKPTALNGRMFEERWWNKPNAAFVLSIFVFGKRLQITTLALQNHYFLLIIKVSNLTLVFVYFDDYVLQKTVYSLMSCCWFY